MPYTREQITSVWGDPEFHTLPLEARRAIMAEVDSDFAALPPEAQDKIFDTAARRLAPQPQPEPPQPNRQIARDANEALAMTGLPPAEQPKTPIPEIRELGTGEYLTGRRSSPPPQPSPPPASTAHPATPRPQAASSVPASPRGVEVPINAEELDPRTGKPLRGAGLIDTRKIGTIVTTPDGRHVFSERGHHPADVRRAAEQMAKDPPKAVTGGADVQTQPLVDMPEPVVLAGTDLIQNPTLTAFNKSLSEGLQKGTVGTVGGLAEWTGGVTGIKPLQTAGEAVSNVSEGLSAGNRLDPTVQKDPLDDPAVMGKPEWWAMAMGSGLGSMLPMLATGGVTAAGMKALVSRGMVKGPVGQALVRWTASGVGGATEGLTAGALAYSEAKRQGRSDEEAAREAALVAVGTGATSAVALGEGVFGGLRNPLARAAAGMGAEGAQEVVQTGIENVAAQYRDPRPITSGMIEAGVAGALTGGAVGPFTGEFSAPPKPVDVDEQVEIPSANGPQPGTVIQIIPDPKGNQVVVETPGGPRVTVPQNDARRPGEPSPSEHAAQQQQAQQDAQQQASDAAAAQAEADKQAADAAKEAERQAKERDKQLEGIRKQAESEVSDRLKQIKEAQTLAADPEKLEQVRAGINAELDALTNDLQTVEQRLPQIDPASAEGVYEAARLEVIQQEIQARKERLATLDAQPTQAAPTTTGPATPGKENSAQGDTAVSEPPGEGVIQPSTPEGPVSAGQAPPSVTIPPTLEGGNGTSEPPVQSGGTGEGTPVREPRQPSGPVALGNETEVRVPGEQRSYKGRYAVRELSDLFASHSGLSWQPNPDYWYKNDRNYADPVNQERVVLNSSPERFDPAYLVNDNPDATNGPPVIDAHGNVLGGNSRTMILQRVYGRGGHQAYIDALAGKVAQFGIDPSTFAGMKQPVLVREIDVLAGQEPRAITDLNKTGTAALTGAEQATADARMLPDEMVDYLSGVLDDAGEGATLASLLDTASGPEIINKLTEAGVFTAQEKPKLIDGRTGAVTSHAKDRISKMLLGILFRDSEQVQRTAASIRNKLERVVAPVMRVQGKEGWNLIPDIQEALDLLEYAAAHDRKDFRELLKQPTMFGGEGEGFSDRAILIAEFLRDKTPTEAAKALRRYATDSVPTMFGEVTPEQAFVDTFGKIEGLTVPSGHPAANVPTPTPTPAPTPRPTGHPAASTPTVSNDTGTPTTDAPTTPTGSQDEPLTADEPIPGAEKLVAAIRGKLRAGESLGNNVDFMTLVRETTGLSVAEGTITTKDAYDILETAVNQQLSEAAQTIMWRTNADVKDGLKSIRERIMSLLPTQSVRSQEQDKFQQFSTPPTEAYIAARLASLTDTDLVLEPSAGTGGLAAFAKAAGATVLANEISPRRAALLRMSGYDVTTQDAEQLHNLWSRTYGDVEPTVVLMNPPFSASGTRGVANSNDIGYRHVMQALRILAPGGRLVAILGEGATPAAPNARKFWADVRKVGTIRANVGVDGKEYSKYGTTFGNRIVVIDKTPDAQGSIVTGEFKTLEEVWDAVQHIAADRKPVEPGARGNGSQPAAGVGSTAPNGVDGTGRPTNSGRSGEPSGKPGRSGSVGSSAPAGPSAGSGSTAPAAGGQSGVRPEGSPAPSGSEPAADDRSDDAPVDVPPAVTAQPVVEESEEVGDYVAYGARRVPAAWGAKPHEAVLVETQSMAAVAEPPLHVKPNLPEAVIKNGDLSASQLTAVSLAVQNHSKDLPDGRRQGMFIGDGTGSGKGRTNAAIALHYWRSLPEGKRRVVWLSYNEELATAARDDLDMVGGKEVPIYSLEKTKADAALKYGDGILFIPYSKLASSKTVVQSVTDGMMSAVGLRRGQQQRAFRRLEQIKDWAGEDAVLIFDEAHKAKNAVVGEQEGRRAGRQQSSATGIAVLEIQNLLPRARVTYSSATGFSDVANLGYANRLGLWGEGTAFKDFDAFRSVIEQGGIGLMEMVARNLKAQGKYVARFISFKGVDFREVVHNLTDEQEKMYDTAAEAWQTVLQNINAALAETEANARAKAGAKSLFWSYQQRFFKALLTAQKMPSLFKDLDEQLAAGKAAVISIMSTGEAQQNRALEKAHNEEAADLEDLDLSPSAVLMDMVDKGFPTVQYVEVPNPEDPTKTIKVVALDSDGNVIHNAEAVAMKEALLDRLSRLRETFPDSAIDQIINKYGSNRVAELTKRSQRFERINGQRQLVNRGSDLKKTNLREMAAFQDGEKDIAIISAAASTGISLHADKRKKNQKRRAHFILELKWSADMTMQDMGRTHRTNQAMPPEYILLSVNVGGDKRFSATVARRMEQLGALSRGSRSGSGAGNELAKYNYESPYGSAAVRAIVEDLFHGQIEGGKDILRKMALIREPDPENPNDREEDDAPEVPVKQFLNRILALPVKLQNEVFEQFAARFEHAIERAKELGTFDEGAQEIKAEEITFAGSPRVVNVDESGAEAVYYHLEVKEKRNRLSFSEIAGARWIVKNIRSGRLVVVDPDFRQRVNHSTGAMERVHWVKAASGNGEYIQASDLADSKKYERLTPDAAKAEWEKQYEEAGEWHVRNVHLIGGSVIPIWTRLQEQKGGNAPTRSSAAPSFTPLKVKIAKVGGERILGVEIGAKRITEVLRSLGAGVRTDPNAIQRDVMDNNTVYNLAEGVSVARVRIAGEYRMELRNVPQIQRGSLPGMGVMVERIQFQTRFFIPTRDTDVLKRILDRYPPQESAHPAARARSGEAGIMAPDLFTPWRWGKQEQQDDPGEDFTFEDEEIEKRFQASGKPTEKELKAKIREALETAKSWTRVYRHLPAKEYSRLIHELKRFEKQGSIASSRALHILLRESKGLSPKQFQLFRRKVVLDDLVETLEAWREQGKITDEQQDVFKLAFGFTPETLQKEHERLSEAVGRSEAVQKAIAAREEAWDMVRAEYLDAMRAAGADQDKRFTRRNYFRHRVLEYLQEQVRNGTVKLRTPTGASYLRHRHVEAAALDYSTNYLETEFEIVAQLLTDAAKARMVAWIANPQNDLNILDQLKEQARWRNKAAVMPYFEALAAEANKDLPPEKEPLTGEDMFRRILNRDQAIAMEEILEAAADDLLPVGPNGEWADFVNDLAEAYIEQKTAAEAVADDFGEAGGRARVNMKKFQRYLTWVLQEAEDAGEAAMSASRWFHGVNAKRQKMQAIAGDQWVTWEDLIPEGYEAWQPNPGNALYLGYSLPEKVAQRIVEALGQEVGVTSSEIQRAMMVGGKRPYIVIPTAVRETIENLHEEREKGIHRAAGVAQNLWKQYQLQAPQRFVKYNIRNLSGDAEITFVGNPKAVRRVKQAGKELLAYYKTREMTPELESWFMRGGFQSNLQAQEIGDVNNLKEFERFMEQHGHPAARLNPADAVRRWFHFAREKTDLREGLLRYANYLEYLEQMRKSKDGTPDNWGASIPDHVRQLEDIEDRAYKLSNDLMGAYDEVSALGRYLRRHWMPFWSYQELNMRRYARLLKNAAHDDKLAGTIGRKILGAGLNPYTYWRVGKTVGMMYAFWGFLNLMNDWLWPEEEASLRKEVRARPHIILGRGPQGQTYYFPRLGNLPDILEWFDADETLPAVRDWLDGKVTALQVARTIAAGPVEKVVQGLTPTIKLPAELLAGQSYYPDIKHPRKIHDRIEYLADHFSLGDVYRRMTGKPTAPFGLRTATDYAIYEADAKQSAYYDVLDLKRGFLESRGKASFSEFKDAKGNALRNLKLAIRKDDPEAFTKYLTEYALEGGTPEDMNRSIDALHPLANLKPELRNEFVASLNPEDRKRLALAIRYFEEVFKGPKLGKYVQQAAPKVNEAVRRRRQ